MTYKLPLATETEFGIMLPGVNLAVTNGVVDSTGGGGIATDSYYGKFYSSTTQTNTAINTAIPVQFPNSTLSNGISVSGTNITFANAGVYTVTYELQAEILSGGGGDIDVWATINGVNFPQSNAITTLAGGGARTIINQSFLMSLTAGQVVNIRWSSPIAAMQLTAVGTQTGPTRPSTNSANFLATLVKAIP